MIPKIVSLGIVIKKQKMIPKDIMEKVWSNLTVKEYIMRTIIEGRRWTHVDRQTVLCEERLPSSRPSK